jgi:chemotaxis response regulator CheB
MTIRVGIVNDIRLAREVLRRVVVDAKDMEILWTAHDGQEAVNICAERRPDIILMDLVMPIMNGATATQLIMRDSPCPVLLVTSTIDGHMELVYQGLSFGALDVTTTPVLGDKRDTDNGDLLRQKIRALHSLAKHSELLPESRLPRNTSTSPARKARGQNAVSTVFIGASTGGPAALVEILQGLDAGFTAPIVIAQHIDSAFVAGLARWLNSSCDISVSIAQDGEPLRPGQVYLADSKSHLVVGPDSTVRYTTEPGNGFYHPSIDVLFCSAAQHATRNSVGVLLTGMGRDGAKGLLAMRDSGLRTIVQSQDSCVVGSMPASALKIGAATHNATPIGIANFLTSLS